MRTTSWPVAGVILLVLLSVAFTAHSATASSYAAAKQQNSERSAAGRLRLTDFIARTYSVDSVYFDYYWAQGWGWTRDAEGALVHNNSDKLADASRGQNCGPASVAMALRYATNNSLAARSLSPEQIRMHGMRKAARATTTGSDIMRALSTYNIGHQAIAANVPATDVIAAADRELTNPIAPTLWTHLVILPIIPTYIRNSAAIVLLPPDAPCSMDSCIVHDGKKYKYSSLKSNFTGKYYQYGGIHWVLLTSSYEIDGEPYFLVHDPNVFNKTNYYYFGDYNEPKGSDAFYSYADVTKAYGAANNRDKSAFPVIVTNTPANPAIISTAAFIDAQTFAQAAVQPGGVSEHITTNGDVNFPPGTYFAPGQVVRKTWLLRNTGDSDVMFEYTLRQYGGTQVESYGGSYLPAIMRGETQEASVLLRAPLTPGVYDTKWAVYNADDEIISDLFTFRFIVHGSVPAVATPTPLPDQCNVAPATPGVILYRDKDYQGRCSYIAGDTPDLALLEVGDNSASSVRINGPYQIKLYEDTGYGGRREEVGTSDPDLDRRSLGEQYSSLRIIATASCANEGAPGVFLYEKSNFGGSCYNLVANSRDLGQTIIGDNDVSSVRVNGDYAVELYENKDYGGRSDEITKNEANLDTRSLGNQYSSARLKVVVRCGDTSKLGVYLYDGPDYQGNCAYLAADLPDLSVTPVGDNGGRSIRIVGEVYALLYPDRDYGGIPAKIEVDTRDLRGGPVGDNVSSLRILPKNRPPQPPQLLSPVFPEYPTAHVLNLGEDVSICWEAVPDPDGDALTFQARLLSATQEIASGWTSDTCWVVKPAASGTYAVSVRAKDAEYTSDWSGAMPLRIGEFEVLATTPLTYYSAIPLYQRIYAVGTGAGGVLQLDIYATTNKVNLSLVGSLPLGRTVYGGAIDPVRIAAMGQYLLLYYPAVNSSSGALQVVDILDPIRPRLLSELALPLDLWAGDLMVRGVRLLIATADGDLLVIDLTQPSAPRLAGAVRAVEPGYQNLSISLVAAGADSVWVAVGGSLVLVDVPATAQPGVRATFDLRTLTGVNTFQVNGTHHYADRLYVADGNGGVLHVFDVADPQNPRHLGIYEGCYMNQVGRGLGGQIIGAQDRALFYTVAGHVCLLEITESGELMDGGIGKLGTVFNNDPIFDSRNLWLTSIRYSDGLVVGTWVQPYALPPGSRPAGIVFLRYQGAVLFPLPAQPRGDVATPGATTQFSAAIGAGLTVTLGGDAVTEPVFLSVIPVTDQPLPSTLTAVGEPFSLRGYAADGREVTSLAAPLTLELDYTATGVGAAAPSQEIPPTLYYWRESPVPQHNGWQAAPATVDAQLHKAKAQVEYLGSFVLATGAAPHGADYTLYCPLIKR